MTRQELYGYIGYEADKWPDTELALADQLDLQEKSYMRHFGRMPSQILEGRRQAQLDAELNRRKAEAGFNAPDQTTATEASLAVERAFCGGK
jgi:hypothetical protein